MGLGSTAKKIQTLADTAEKLYKQIQDLQQRIVSLEEAVDNTHDTVTTLDHQVTEQRALLKAIADEQGLDADQILADAAIDEAEAGDEAEDATDAEGASDSTDAEAATADGGTGGAPEPSE